MVLMIGPEWGEVILFYFSRKRVEGVVKVSGDCLVGQRHFPSC